MPAPPARSARARRTQARLLRARRRTGRVRGICRVRGAARRRDGAARRTRGFKTGRRLRRSCVSESGGGAERATRMSPSESQAATRW